MGRRPLDLASESAPTFASRSAESGALDCHAPLGQCAGHLTVVRHVPGRVGRDHCRRGRALARRGRRVRGARRLNGLWCGGARTRALRIGRALAAIALGWRGGGGSHRPSGPIGSNRRRGHGLLGLGVGLGVGLGWGRRVGAGQAGQRFESAPDPKGERNQPCGEQRRGGRAGSPQQTASRGPVRSEDRFVRRLPCVLIQRSPPDVERKLPFSLVSAPLPREDTPGDPLWPKIPAQRRVADTRAGKSRALFRGSLARSWGPIRFSLRPCEDPRDQDRRPIPADVSAEGAPSPVLARDELRS